MAAQGINRTALANLVGVTQGAISRFFTDEQTSSVLVPKIFAALGLPFAEPDGRDEMQQLLALLTDRQRDAVLTFLRELVEARKIKP